jgi:hypothetical protein
LFLVPAAWAVGAGQRDPSPSPPPSQPPSAAPDLEKADEQLLRDARVATDVPGLLAFLRERTLTEDDRKQLRALVRRLGAESYAQREEASQALTRRGRPALPLLREALKDPDVEIARRAERCIEEIEQGPGAALPVAAVRLLAKRAAPGERTAALEALVGYAAFVDDEVVEEEVLGALAALAVKVGKGETPLVGALKSELPVRRAAAAYALGRVAEQRDAVRPLLKDPDARVRLRATQALLAARDREAVPALIELLGDGPREMSGRAEDLLFRVAGPLAPTLSQGNGSALDRRKCRDGWQAWWRENGPKVDLAKMDTEEVYRGLTVIPEMHANKVWECGPDGKVRWQLDNIPVPRDARVLPGGRVLIAEVGNKRIAERDLKGNVLWTYALDNPAYCERLPNGNTFVGNLAWAGEVTPAGKAVFSYKPEEGFMIHGMHRKRDGNLVCLSSSGILREVDPAGKQVFSVQLSIAGNNWCGVETLPGDRYLIVANSGDVHEVDRTGKSLWHTRVDSAAYAERLPNGNTLVGSYGQRKIVEVDRAGKTLWEVKASTTVWRFHRR